MAVEVKKEIELEIAYVLFIDIVGYSKLVTHEQRRSLELLNQIVREAEHFRAAEANGRLITVPTGDGMALVFYNTPEAPVECALEISSAAREHRELKLRMGIHSGAVSGVVDVSGRSNIAGAGINIAQRVMNCGDAGHVLVSKHMAEDLEQYGHWRRHLHDLGDCEVKHGVRIAVVNLYTENLGNPEVPHKFRQARQKAAVPARPTRGKWIGAVAVLVILGVVAAVVLRMVGTDRRAVRSATQTEGRPSGASLPAPEKSVAVLPFDNMSRDPDNAFFTDGVQDQILTALATKVTRTMISLDRDGNTRPLHQALDEIRARDSEAIKSVADYWLNCALAERDAAAAEAALAALGDNFFGNDAVHLRHDFGEGLIARMLHDEAKAHEAFTAARTDQEKRLRDQPDYGPSLCVLALIDAGLGRKEEALREGRRAIELLPVEKDSINGPHMIEYFAITAAWVGEKDLACQQLTAALQAKSYGTISYGALKLTPYWAPLRGDARFQKLVASLAPKN